MRDDSTLLSPKGQHGVPCGVAPHPGGGEDQRQLRSTLHLAQQARKETVASGRGLGEPFNAPRLFKLLLGPLGPVKGMICQFFKFNYISLAYLPIFIFSAQK